MGIILKQSRVLNLFDLKSICFGRNESDQMECKEIIKVIVSVSDVPLKFYASLCVDYYKKISEVTHTFNRIFSNWHNAAVVCFDSHQDLIPPITSVFVKARCYVAVLTGIIQSFR